MLEDFQNVGIYSLTISDILKNILVALLCGYLISVFYRISYKGPGYSVAFINSLILLAMITAVVLMVIGNNLARAFGLVGAMSIIRFRTAVKDTQDIIFIFFSLAVGLAAGVGYHTLAIVATLLVGGINWLVNSWNQNLAGRKEYLLQFTFESDNPEDAPYQSTLKSYCRNYQVINARSGHLPNGLELSYYVRLKDMEKNNQFVRELSGINGVGNVNLFFDEEKI